MPEKKTMSLQQVHEMQREIFNRDFAEGPFGGVVQNLSYDKRVRTAVRYLKDSDMLASFGCGDGTVARRIADHVASVTAIDISENAIHTAKTYNGSENIVYAVSTIEDFQSEVLFDAITFFEVLEHVFDPPAILEKINSYLHPGGYLFLSTPNFNRR